MPPKPPKTKSPKRPKRIAFILTATVGGLLIALTLAELALRAQRRAIDSAEHLDPGLVEYDPQLGWRLTPNWQGRHTHYDYTAHYSTNPHAYRGQPPNPDTPPNSRPRLILLGDSFTFALGANDDQTFAHHLATRFGPDNYNANPPADILNFAVPGYSTDQQLLQLKSHAVYSQPTHVAIVVYLGNDIVDNPLPFPLQADRAKPYYELTDAGLVLRNIPVPPIKKPPALRSQTLTSIVLGSGQNGSGQNGTGPNGSGPNGTDPTDIIPRPSTPSRSFAGLEIVRRLTPPTPAPPDLAQTLERRMHRPLNLFHAIIHTAQSWCEQRNITLTLILLPGRSYLDAPDSISAQFQEHQRQKITTQYATTNPPVIDLAAALRTQHRAQKTPTTKTPWYYPHDGHLTPQGHTLIADLLEPRLHEMLQPH